MIKRALGIFIVTILLFITVGCSSFESMIRSSLEEKPIWVYEPQVSRDQIAFVGTGEAQSESLAALRSFESILEQISLYIGKNISKDFITELSERKSIERYQLKITRVFVKDVEGAITVHHLAVADKALVTNDRSELLLEIEQRTNIIKSLQAKASTLLREDRDIEAATQYLSIAKEASSVVNESGTQYYTDAMDRFFSILEKIRITHLSEESTTSLFVFQTKRGSRSLSPKVVNAPLLVSFTALNAREDEYLDHKTIHTDSSGKATFINTNPSMVSIGEMNIYIDISPFAPYMAYISEDDRAMINKIVSQSTITIPYIRDLAIGSENVLLSIEEYSIKGDRLSTTYSQDILYDSLLKKGITPTFVGIVNDDDEEFFAEVIAKYKKGNFLFGKCGITAINQTRNGYAVTVLGEVSLYPLPVIESKESTTEVRAVGWGLDLKEATKNAFSQFGTIAISLLNRLLYAEP